MAALLAWLANPANQALLVSLIENGITAGEKAYQTWELQSLNDLLAVVKADMTALAADVKQMDSDIDARDKQLEADLDKAGK